MCRWYFANVEAEDVLHVRGQFDEEHVPAEILARVCNQNGPEGTRSENGLPRNRQLLFLRRNSFSNDAIEWEKELLLFRMKTRVLLGRIVYEKNPQNAPNGRQSSKNVKHRLPAEGFGKETGEWQRHNRPHRHAYWQTSKIEF